MDGDAGMERDIDDNGGTRSVTGVNGDMGDGEKVGIVFHFLYLLHIFLF